MNREEKPMIRFKKEKMKGACSDILSFLTTINPKFTTVSYEVRRIDESGMTHFDTSDFEKPTVAAKKINSFINDMISQDGIIQKQRVSDR
ncbi:MAG: hypothetical protein ACH350_06570 [Parachlamydiaceae bacterium]